jgi:hypothetical protein
MVVGNFQHSQGSQKVRPKPRPKSVTRVQRLVRRVESVDYRRRQALIYAQEYGFWGKLTDQERQALSERPTAHWTERSISQVDRVVRRTFRLLLSWHGRELWVAAGVELTDFRRSDEYLTYQLTVEDKAAPAAWAELRRLQQWLVGLDRLVPGF